MGEYMGSRELSILLELVFLAAFLRNPRKAKMSEAQDAFIIFDEAYEGVDVDAFYLGDILRALGCNVTNAKVAELGGIHDAVKADLSATGVKEDYIEGLKVFDKEGSGKVPLPEVQNVLVSLGEKLEPQEAEKLCALLGIVADEEDNISYMDFIDKLLAATA